MSAGLPPRLERALEGYTAVPVRVGKSGATVLRLEHPTLEGLFLKSAPVSALEPLSRDAEVMRWLEAREVRVPNVRLVHLEADTEWVLTTTLPGRDASSPWNADQIDRVVTALATALRDLHALPIHDCPFDRRWATVNLEKTARVQAGTVDEDDFEPEHAGWSAAQVLAWLEAHVPAMEDLVFTHGDCCLPNAVVDADFNVAWIDLGRAGVADRYQDLALVVRSMESPVNAQFNGWSARFLERYGIGEPEQQKLEFYRVLDELF
jgi:aminoglycoside phosphotransferase